MLGPLGPLGRDRITRTRRGAIRTISGSYAEVQKRLSEEELRPATDEEKIRAEVGPSARIALGYARRRKESK